MDAEQKATIAVRNALFEVSDGKPFGAIMKGIIMAQVQMAADACAGDEDKCRGVLTEYHKLMIEAVPIYCTQTITGQLNPS